MLLAFDPLIPPWGTYLKETLVTKTMYAIDMKIGISGLFTITTEKRLKKNV